MVDRRALALCLACALAGCTALPGISPESPGSPGPTTTAGATASAVPTGGPSTTASGTATGTETATGTGTAPPTTGPGTDSQGPFTVEYAVRAGSVADAFASVTVEFEVVFAERAGDLDYCIGTLLSSRYEVTATPLPSPAGACDSVSGITVDLAALNDTRNLGPFTAAGRYDGAHALVVRDVVPVYENGTTVTAVHDVDFRPHSQEGRDPGYYGVEINVTAAGSDAPWQFVVSEREFTPFDVATPTGTPAGNGTGTPAANGTGTPAANGTGSPAGSDTATATAAVTATAGESGSGAEAATSTAS
jgi:hypothetical protein